MLNKIFTLGGKVVDVSYISLPKVRASGLVRLHCLHGIMVVAVSDHFVLELLLVEFPLLVLDLLLSCGVSS